MKVKEHITINGETFSIEGQTNTKGHVEHGNNLEDIYHAYDRPSATKVAIWKDWCNWAFECGAQLAIESYNCFRFTIRGWVKYNGKVYQLYITDRYNRAYEVV